MSFFSDGPKPNEIENWVCVQEAGTEFEIELAKNYLSSLNIPSNILSKRDSAYNLNVGEMSRVFLYVPKDYETKARKALVQLEEENPDFNTDSDQN